MCGKDIESTNHFLLQCSLFSKERQVLMNKFHDIDSSLTNQNEISLFYTLLFGKENINDSETLIFLMQQKSTSYQRKSSTFLYLNMSKPLQLISTTIMNDSIVFELNTPFSLFLFILLFPRYTKQYYIQALLFCVPLLYILFLFRMYLCNYSNCTCVYV